MIFSKNITPFILLGMCFFASSCSSPPENELSPLPPNATILAFGDSLTSGFGSGGLGQTDPAASYPALLQQQTGLNVINAGTPGEISQQGLQRLPQLLKNYSPDLVIICHGGNDLLQKLPEAHLKHNIIKMTELCISHGAQVLLVAPPSPGLLLRPTPIYKDIAEEMGIALEPTALSDILQDGALKSDYIHPNRKGYKLLADAIFNLLESRGVLPHGS